MDHNLSKSTDVIRGCVAPHEAGMRLLAFLCQQVEGAVSAKALKRAIDGRLCTINGHVEYFSTHKLRAGDKIELRLVDKQMSALPISILYEDEYVLVCNKPAGTVSDDRAFSFKGCVLVHRLDKDTSGALLFAKSSQVYEKMCTQFRKREVQKFYLALVDGQVAAEGGKLENYLVKKNYYQGQTVWGITAKQDGLYALTYWNRVQLLKNASLLRCQPVTGRMHQLRVQLHGMGHPIIGDYQYSKRFSCSFSCARHLLHAERIVMNHPITDKRLEVKAPLERSDMLMLLGS